MRNLLDVLLFRKRRTDDEVSTRVFKASASQEEASKSLVETVRKIMSEREPQKVQPVLIRKQF